MFYLIIGFWGNIMKNLFVYFLMLTSVSTVFGDMKFNNESKSFYSLPVTPDINQSEYNDLCFQIVLRLSTYRKDWNKNKVNAAMQGVYSYLKMLNTPASLRLFQDVQRLSIVELCLGLCVTVITFDQEDVFDHISLNGILNDIGSPLPGHLNRDLILEVLIQCFLTVITCWNNGIYGKSVQEQINTYLNGLDSPESHYILSLGNA